MRHALIATCLALAAGAAGAQVTVPNTFSSGSPAKAADVNANFQALAAAVNALAARVAKLESVPVTQADLAGTYTLMQFQTELGGGSNRKVDVYTSTRTVTLAADGTGSMTTGTETGSDLNVSTGALSPINRTDSGSSLTWSYTGGVLTLFGSTFAVAKGGTVMFRSSANTSDGTNVMLVMVRK